MGNEIRILLVRIYIYLFDNRFIKRNVGDKLINFN